MNGQGTESAVTPSRVGWIVLLMLLTLAFLLGGWLRTCNYSESLWVDELHTSWVTRGSWGELVNRAAWGNQPPLYFAIAKSSILVAGESEWTLRSPSWLAGFALIGVGGYLAFQLTGKPTLAFVTVCLLALDVELVFYAQEARPYACVQLAVLLHVVLLAARLPSRSVNRRRAPRDSSQVRQSTGKWHDWSIRIGWISTFWLAFYCHYTAAVVLVWEAWMVLGLLLGSVVDRKVVQRLAFDAGLAALGMLPAIGHVLAVSQRQSDWSVLVQLWPLPRPVAMAILIYLFPAIAIAVGGAVWPNQRTTSSAQTADAFRYRFPSRFVLAWGASLVVSIACLWLASCWLGVAWFFPRYFIGLWPLLILLPALVLAITPSRVVRAIGLVAVLFIAVLENPVINAPLDERIHAIERGENWRDAIASLGEVDPSVDMLYLFPNLVEDGRLVEDSHQDFKAYLQFPVRALYELPTHNQEVEWQVVVKSLRQQPIYLERELDRMGEFSRFHLLVRGEPQDVEWVLKHLADGLAPRGLTFDAIVDAYGSVFVVDVTVLTPEALRVRQANRISN